MSDYKQLIQSLKKAAKLADIKFKGTKNRYN